MNRVTKIGGITVVALPLISQFIIRDSIPLDKQLYFVIAIVVIVTTVAAGIFYFRTTDLETSISELKIEHKDNIRNIEGKHSDEITSLKAEIIDLKTNREALKSIIEHKNHTNQLLNIRLALYSFGITTEKRRELEDAATIYIGGVNDGNESSQNN